MPGVKPSQQIVHIKFGKFVKCSHRKIILCLQLMTYEILDLKAEQKQPEKKTFQRDKQVSSLILISFHCAEGRASVNIVKIKRQIHTQHTPHNSHLNSRLFHFQRQDSRTHLNSN